MRNVLGNPRGRSPEPNRGDVRRIKVSRRRYLKLLTFGLAGFRGSRGSETPQGRSRIYFSALDGDERPRLGLSASEFTLRVDGKPLPMEDFEAGRPYSDRSEPIAVWILVDF